VSLVGPFDLSADVTRAAVAELGIDTGSAVWASLKATEVGIQTLDG
jgi:molybdopterin-binding protein